MSSPMHIFRNCPVSACLNRFASLMNLAICLARGPNWNSLLVPNLLPNMFVKLELPSAKLMIMPSLAIPSRMMVDKVQANFG